MSDLKKFDKIIPAGKKEYAYQCENVSTVASVVGTIPYKSGSLPYLNNEQHEVGSYELRISNFTSNSLTVELIKKRNDIGKQRKANGKVVYEVLYQTSMSFAGLVNQIFKGVEVGEYPKEEAIPDKLAEIIRDFYSKP